MSTTLYDFDTRHAPFEALAPWTPYAPWALMAWFAAPMQWWANSWLNACGMLSESMLSAMIYPYAPPQAHAHASLDSPRQAMTAGVSEA